MLRITVPAKLPNELWDEKTDSFVYVGGNEKEQTLQLEHSLVSLSKWESKWCIPFLANSKKITDDQFIDYIRCMTITPNVNPSVYQCLTQENIEQITDYINAPMTATTFRNDTTAKKNREITTAEIIYHQMIELGIPFECQKWHLNRLLTLIRVRSIKLAPPKKRSRSEIAMEYDQLNRSRLKALSTKG